MANKATYNQESIEVLKGADRVRKRPAVIFGSDGIEGCEHSVFEIISNSVDEAREGFGNTITVTKRRRQLSVISRHIRTRSLRHPVCLGIYGGGNTFKRLLLSSEFQGRQARR